MPLPTPRKDEKKSDFISRCVSSDVVQKESEDNDQAVAICNTQWDKTKDSEASATLRKFLK